MIDTAINELAWGAGHGLRDTIWDASDCPVGIGQAAAIAVRIVRKGGHLPQVILHGRDLIEHRVRVDRGLPVVGDADGPQGGPGAWCRRLLVDAWRNASVFP